MPFISAIAAGAIGSDVLCVVSAAKREDYPVFYVVSQFRHHLLDHPE